jgi:hypothetical protein
MTECGSRFLLTVGPWLLVAIGLLAAGAVELSTVLLLAGHGQR